MIRITTSCLLVLASGVVGACGVRQAEAPKRATPEEAARAEAFLNPLPWWKEASPCPEGAAIKGAEPPQGNALWCETKDGKAQGPRTEWFANGKKAKELVFRSGKQDGRYTTYFENGQIAEEGRHRAGVLEGRHVTYFENGQRKSDAEYRGGEQHGKVQRWNEDGQKIYEAEYRLGKPNGMVLSWYDDGDKRDETEYRDGAKHGSFRSFNPDGTKTVGRNSKDKPTGIWEAFTPGGKKNEEVIYVNGLKEGKVTRWHESGFHSLEGQYQADKKEGTFTYFDAEVGSVALVEHYKHDKLVSKRVTKHGKSPKKGLKTKRSE